MFLLFKKVVYYIGWIIKWKIFKKKIPLTCSIILTDKCNLSCKHCIVSNLGYEDPKFEEVKRDIKKLYDRGCRMLVITGGEPFLWKDGNYTLNDVISYAKEIGFFRVVVCTNGTFELESNADYLWVSLDGSEEENDKIRGEGVYKKVMENISKSSHNKIYINFVISKITIQNLENSVEDILGNKRIKGILFHLFTPYIGLTNEMGLDSLERKKAIRKILKIKKKYRWKVLNTFAGIKALEENRWERPIHSSVVINRGKITLCCCREGIYNKEICKNCGCTPAIETWVLEKLKLTAIIENFRLL